MASAFDEMYLWGLRATRPEAPILVYIVSVMNLSRRQATMISSEIGESFERSVAASRRWWTLIVAEECLFIVVKAERALKTAALYCVCLVFLVRREKGARCCDRGARMLGLFFISHASLDGCVTSALGNWLPGTTGAVPVLQNNTV